VGRHTGQKDTYSTRQLLDFALAVVSIFDAGIFKAVSCTSQIVEENFWESTLPVFIHGESLQHLLMWRWPIAIACSLLRVLVTLVSYGKWLNRPRFWLGVQTRVNLREHWRFGDHSRYLRGQESPSNGAFLRAMDIFEGDNVRIFFPHAVNLTLNWLAAAAVGCHSKFSQWTIHPLRRGLRSKLFGHLFIDLLTLQPGDDMVWYMIY